MPANFTILHGDERRSLRGDKQDTVSIQIVALQAAIVGHHG